MVLEDALTLKFAALADPTRRAILLRLSQGEATVSELQAPFRISQPAISKHLKVLEGAGLIERGQAAQSRPRRLNHQALKETVEWFDHFRSLWNDSFDRLEDLLEANTEPKPELKKDDRS